MKKYFNLKSVQIQLWTPLEVILNEFCLWITVRCMQRSRKWVFPHWIRLYLPSLTLPHEMCTPSVVDWTKMFYRGGINLNMRTHLKITLPLWKTCSKYPTGGVWVSNGVAQLDANTRGVLRFKLDRGVPLEPQNPYPSLRVILAEKDTHF